MREIDMIVIHCSATRCDRDYPFKTLDKDHRSKGWNGCGYHRYITRDGTVHVGRPYEQVGAHVGPKYNPHSIGICYEGGLNAKGQPDDTRTEAQKRSMMELLRELSARFPKAVILGHRDLPGVRKDCPCYDVRSDLKREGFIPGRNSLPEISGTAYGGENGLPDIRGRPDRGRYIIPESRDTLYRGRFSFPRKRGGLYRGRYLFPEIQG